MQDPALHIYAGVQGVRGNYVKMGYRSGLLRTPYSTTVKWLYTPGLRNVTTTIPMNNISKYTLA